MKKELIQSSIFRYIEILVTMSTSLLLTPYMISNLGELNYGLWILILSTVGWFSFIDLGFSSAIQRQITFAIENKDSERVNEVFSCAVALFSGLGGIATIGVFFLGVFPQLIGIPEAQLSTASTIILILCLKIFMDFLMGATHGIFVGHIRYDIDANIETITTLTKAGFVFLLLEKYGLYGVVFATMVADILKNLIKVYFAKQLQKTLSFSWKVVTFSEIKELFSFAKYVIASVIAGTIHKKSAPVIIANVLDVSSITMYSVADRLVNMVENLVVAIVGVFEPAFIKMVAKNVEINKFFTFVFSINCFIAGVFLIPLSILANDFIILWVGDKFSFASILTFILVFAFLSRVVLRPITSLLLARAQHQLLSIVNLFGAIVNIGLSIYLGHLYGLIGIVLSTSISFLLVNVFFYILILRAYTKIIISEVRVKFFMLILLYIGMYFFAQNILIETKYLTWMILLANSVVIFLINFILCWVLLLNSDAKNKLISLLTTMSLFKKIKVKFQK